MASPLQPGKKSVNLSSPVRVSRIRRDPPPVAKKVDDRDPRERETRMVVIGVITFALAIAIIVLGFSAYQGEPEAEQAVHINID